jgi:hypothetical protein
MLFTGSDIPKVIYTAPFNDNQISYEEIKSIFIEIYKNGIQTEIDKYYKN